MVSWFAMLGILYILPKNLLSRLVGWAVAIQLPKPFRLWALQKFAKAYRIDLQEAEKPLSDYPSIAEFFTRHLRGGIRPLAPVHWVHPADAKISQIGLISEGQLVQAKGKTYPVDQLVGRPGTRAE